MFITAESAMYYISVFSQTDCIAGIGTSMFVIVVKVNKSNCLLEHCVGIVRGETFSIIPKDNIVLDLLGISTYSGWLSLL